MINHQNIPGKSRHPRFAAGYSLVEVLVAASILAIGVGAAAVLALSMVSQQLGSHQVARAINYQEQACRLFQLGLTHSEITSILPPEAGLANLAIAETSVVNGSVGTVQKGVCTADITGVSLFSTPTSHVNTMVTVRPSTR